jgi:CheY-like chemotaxis protein
MTEELSLETTENKQRTILITEDDDISAELLSEILKEDYVLLRANNGEEALHMMREHAKDIAEQIAYCEYAVFDQYDFGVEVITLFEC